MDAASPQGDQLGGLPAQWLPQPAQLLSGGGVHRFPRQAPCVRFMWLSRPLAKNPVSHSHRTRTNSLSLSLSVPYAGFNAVRLPLGAWHVTHDVDTPGSALRGWSGMCGARYKGWRALPILDDIIRRLRARGILVMLDLHRCVRLSRLSAHTFKLAFTGPSRTGLWPPCGLLGHTYKCSTSAHL